MGLLDLVRKKKEMRKLFGQQELKIIEKQLLGVELSPSEKTRLSRDIRSKFDIISVLSNFEKEFSLKKAQEVKFLIEEAKEIILDFKGFSKVKKIYVFGSYVENKMRLNSDIDIVVEFGRISSREASKFKIKMQGVLNEKIHLSVFNLLPEKIKKEVLGKGRKIYDDGKS